MSIRRGRFAIFAPLVALGLIGAPGLSRGETAEPGEAFEGTRSLVGSYLAGRFARAQNDSEEAADFYRKRPDPRSLERAAARAGFPD